MQETKRIKSDAIANLSIAELAPVPVIILHISAKKSLVIYLETGNICIVYCKNQDTLNSFRIAIYKVLSLKTNVQTSGQLRTNIL